MNGMQWITHIINKLEEKTHITPLLPSEKLVVSLENDDVSLLMELSNKGCRVLTEYQGDITVHLAGEGLKYLWINEAKLQSLISRGEIGAIGSFRHILLLDAIFFLCRPALQKTDIA